MRIFQNKTQNTLPNLIKLSFLALLLIAFSASCTKDDPIEPEQETVNNNSDDESDNGSTDLGNTDNTDNSGSTDNVAPSAATDFTAEAQDGTILLEWTNPTDADFDHVLITYGNQSITSSNTSITVTGLTNGTNYTFTIVAKDQTGNVSTSKTVSATPISTSAYVYPTDLIPSLVDWKVTLPVDANGTDSSDETVYTNRNTNPWEIKDNNLIDFDYTPYFELRNDEVIFRAHCGGATTSGSKYPRCELRQRVGGGDNYWSVNDHQKLVTELRVTHTPVVKPEVCMVQIHGPSNEPLRVQYHATNGLTVIWNESNKVKIKDVVSYTLGQKLRVTVEVNNGDITCTIENLDTNEDYTKTWTSNDNTGYFKVGCYTQSSMFLSQFKSEYSTSDAADAYGEVAVTKIDLTETYN